MAGHPTIGTAFVLADEGVIETREGINKLIFEEGVGEIAVSIHVEGGESGRLKWNSLCRYSGGSLEI